MGIKYQYTPKNTLDGATGAGVSVAIAGSPIYIAITGEIVTGTGLTVVLETDDNTTFTDATVKATMASLDANDIFAAYVPAGDIAGETFMRGNQTVGTGTVDAQCMNAVATA